MDDELEIVNSEIIYKLEKPFKFGNEEVVREIKLVEPPAKDMAGIKLEIPTEDAGSYSMDISTCLKVIKACCSEPPSKINMMKTADAISCYAKCIELFFGDSA